MTISFNTNHMDLDFEAFAPEAIPLSSDRIHEAVALTRQIPDESRQWQTYLNGLALFAFEQWLEDGAVDLPLNQEECSIFHPPLANAIEAVCNLKVNEFKICAIAIGSLTDAEIALPRAVVDIPEFIPHFYVLVEVQEELETAAIAGFISYEQLVNLQQTVNLQPDSDWTYQIPLSWFNPDPDQLLLYLSCLEPIAIALPAIPNRLTTLSTVQTELTSVLPQLQSPNFQMWQVLTWEQGVAVLTNPDLLNWVYQLQGQMGETTTIEETRSPEFVQNSLSDLLKLLTQPAVNVGRWLWDEMDELAQELSWVLLPSLAPASAMRSPTEEFEAIVRELQQTGVEIPANHARGAYRDLLLGGIPLRLYALTWSLFSKSIREWTLLLILGTPSGTSLPTTVKLRVSDQTGILVEQGLQPDDDYPYFYTSVVGNWDEKFLVTVSLTPDLEMTLPPFGFDPERQSA